MGPKHSIPSKKDYCECNKEHTFYPNPIPVFPTIQVWKHPKDNCTNEGALEQFVDRDSGNIVTLCPMCITDRHAPVLA